MKVFYGLFQEIGTAFQTPQAFLGPSFRVRHAEAIAIVSKQFVDSINKIT